MSATLKTNFLGISMLNPFMLASAPPSTTPEGIARSFLQGWGGAVLKTAQYTPRWIKQNVTPRIRAIKNRNQIIGFTNFEIGSPKHLQEWADGIYWLKQRFPEHAVFASLMHADVLREDEWRETTRIFDQAGADGFELNLSCSHGQAESGGGAMLGSNDDMIKIVTSWVREETKKPIMPKLTALTMELPEKGIAAKEAGANAITTINTISSLPGINLKTFEPYNSVAGMSAFQGLSGRAIKPIALRSAAQLAIATGLPISASGGIYTWKDAAEFISVGAQTVQLCSAVMEKGYDIIDDLTNGLLQYMNEMNFSTIEDFRGKALSHITSQIELSRDYKMYAYVNKENCVGCGRCAISCRDNGYEAILLDKTAFCVQDKCSGCGLCTQICPTGCIEMTRE